MERVNKIHIPDRFSRRTLIKSLGLAFCSSGYLVACSRGSSDRSWPQTEVEALARSLQQDSDLTEVSRAGEVLLDNQQGRPSLSKLSSMYSNDRIKLYVAKDQKEKEELGLPNDDVASYGEVVGQRMAVVLRHKIDPRAGVTFISEAQYSMPAIAMTTEWLKSNPIGSISNKLSVAKAIHNATANEMMASNLAKHVVYSTFEEPTDPISKEVVKLGSLRGKAINGVPALEVSSYWAHFVLVPDYQKARDKGLIPENLRKTALFRVFDDASEEFKTSGILQKNGTSYNWTQNNDLLTKAWLDTAMKMIIPPNPVIPRPSPFPNPINLPSQKA